MPIVGRRYSCRFRTARYSTVRTAWWVWEVPAVTGHLPQPGDSCPAVDPRDDHVLQPSEYRARLPPVGKHRGVGMRGRFGVVPGVVCLVAG
jgi:hypothetical protein